MNDTQHRISKVYRSQQIRWGSVNFFNGKPCERIDLLTLGQKEKILELAVRVGSIDWFSKMYFETESVKLDSDPDTTFYVPNGNIGGVWPHCGLFGLMDKKGDIST
jgi:hypothetical protein